MTSGHTRKPRSGQLQATWRSFMQGWIIFRRNRLAVFGLAIIIFFGLISLTYPLLRATVWDAQIYNPIVGFDRAYMPHPSPPSWIRAENLPEDSIHRTLRRDVNFDHLLGTDTSGRDILSVLFASTTPTFITGISAAVVTAFFGLLFASLASYYGGRVDAVLSHISDAFLLLPAPIFMIAIGSFFRSRGVVESFYYYVTEQSFSDGVRAVLGPVEFGVLYGIIAGAGGAAVVLRSHGMKVMAMPFIEAARVSGAGAGHIIRRHLIPHMMPLATLYMMITVTWVVVADGFLAFLGFTLTRLNWGTMIYQAFAFQAVNASNPWGTLVPASLAISLFAGAFYLVSQGLHEVIEPRLRDE